MRPTKKAACEKFGHAWAAAMRKGEIVMLCKCCDKVEPREKSYRMTECERFGHTWILGFDGSNIKDAVVVCSTCRIIDPEPEGEDDA